MSAADVVLNYHDLEAELEAEAARERRQNSYQRPNPAPRTRRITITDIEEVEDEDSGEWSLLNSSDASASEDEDILLFPDNLDDDEEEELEEEFLSPEKAFEQLDALMVEYKSKLTTAINSGLQKLARSNKEKRLLIKYLPGAEEQMQNVRIKETKASIYKDWRMDFNKIITGVQKKIEKITHEEMIAAEKLITTSILRKRSVSAINKNKKTIINMEFKPAKASSKQCLPKGSFKKAPKPAAKASSKTPLKPSTAQSANLARLLKDLEKVCNIYQADEIFRAPKQQSSVVPIYRPSVAPTATCGEKTLKQSLDLSLDGPQARLLKRYLQEMATSSDSCARTRPREGGNKGVLSLIEDFKIMHYKEKRPEPPLLRLNSESNSHNNVKKVGQKKPKPAETARKVKDSKEYKLVQFCTNGQERFFLCRRKKQVAPCGTEMEDIFAEWAQNNLNDNCCRPKKVRSRTRKLSHRALRKELLKAAERDSQKPLLYADMVKKNLKNVATKGSQAAVEDIFEAFRDYIRILELGLAKRAAKAIASASESPFTSEDIFKVWRHNLNAERAYVRRARLQALETAAPKKDNWEDILSSATSFQKELRLGAKPTIITTQKDASEKRKSAFSKPGKLRPIAKYVPLGGFGDLGRPRQPEEQPLRKLKRMHYEQEEFFAQWRRHFHEPEALRKRPYPKTIKTATTESIFHDWLQLGNLQLPTDFLPPVAVQNASPLSRKNSSKKRQKRQAEPDMDPDFLPQWAEEGLLHDSVVNQKKPGKGKGKKKGKKH